MNPFYKQFSAGLAPAKPAPKPAATTYTSSQASAMNTRLADPFGSYPIQGSSFNQEFQAGFKPRASSPAGFTPGDTPGGNIPGGNTPGGNTPGGGGGQPSAAAIAAQQKAAQVGQLRNEIISRRERANSIFEALTGAVQALAQEKRGSLESDFGRESARAQEDYTDTSGQLSRAYAGRGLGDSSYRINALDKAGADYGRTVEDLGNQRQSALGQLGGETVGALARIGADREASNSFNLDELGDDVESLMSLRNKLDERIRQAGVQQAEFGTQSGFKGRLGGIAANTQSVGVLKSSLQNLLQTAVPKSTKDKIASAIINNYAPEEANVWQEFWNKESQKAPSVG